MLIKALVKDGLVVGLIVVESLDFAVDGMETVPVVEGQTMPAIGWAYAAGTFTPPMELPPTAEQLAQRLRMAREAARARIRAGRAWQEVQPVSISAGTFEADLDSQRRIGLASQQAQDAIASGTPAQGQLDWETLDGSAITLTARQCINLNKAMWKQIEAAATRARAMRQQVAAALDIPTLDAIAW